jgi:UDP-N-acetylmuramate dehydrogenase
MVTSDPMPPSSREFDELGLELRSALRSSIVRQDHGLGGLTTYRVGGRARLFTLVETSEDLAGLASITSHHHAPLIVVGRGSNMLVSDRGFEGLSIALGEAFATMEHRDDGIVRLGGALSLPAAARRLTAAGLSGFEWAVGVPGSVGGAIRMNAGGHGSDMAASVVGARVVDLSSGAVADLSSADLAFGYRRSSVAARQLVVWADVALQPGNVERGETELRDIVRWRREHQPGGQNAGSVFTNPVDDSAGRLIDVAGLRGHRIGSAVVSVKHANFIQVDEGGSADDVMALMVHIAAEVEARMGVALNAETRLVGFDRSTMSLVQAGRGNLGGNRGRGNRGGGIGG